jgi:hypothetical protein
MASRWFVAAGAPSEIAAMLCVVVQCAAAILMLAGVRRGKSGWTRRVR